MKRPDDVQDLLGAMVEGFAAAPQTPGEDVLDTVTTQNIGRGRDAMIFKHEETGGFLVALFADWLFWELDSRSILPERGRLCALCGLVHVVSFSCCRR